MYIGVLGISCKSAPLTLREKIAQAALLLSSQNVVISTCHRTEIYFSGDDLAASQAEIFQHLKQVSLSHEHAFYSYFGAECFYHLACVTAGLDSLLLAESDIQRQVKVAYETARHNHSLPSPLHFLFQKSLKLGKTVRSLFSLFQTAWHLEATLYQLTHKLLGANPRLLFVGNSDINRKIIHYFWRKGHRQMTLSTRNLNAALPFAVDYHLTLRDRQEIASWPIYDGVITATTAPSHLITPVPHPQTRLILDLSVPRVVSPTLQDHPTLTLLNMEEIGKFFDNIQDSRLSEAQVVKNYLETATLRYISRYTSKTIELNRQFS
jgi:glutamyl-tRNA reductase